MMEVCYGEGEEVLLAAILENRLETLVLEEEVVSVGMLLIVVVEGMVVMAILVVSSHRE
jgi:hypothetical protein